jgi:hypothetical protein
VSNKSFEVPLADALEPSLARLLFRHSHEHQATVGVAQRRNRFGDVVFATFTLEFKRGRLGEEISLLGSQHEGPNRLIVDLLGGQVVQVVGRQHGATIVRGSRS